MTPAEIRLFSSNGTYIKDPGGAQENYYVYVTSILPYQA